MKHSYIDQYSDIKSFIHQLDPRVKVIVFFAIIVFVMSTPLDNGHLLIWAVKKNPFLAFFLYAALIAVLVLLSKIPLEFILKRSLVIVPFVLLISVFVPFIKGGKVIGSYSFGSLKLTLTYEGLMTFLSILGKAYLSILSMILLTSSTRFPELLKALGKLKIPRLITMILSFMYRYIFVLQDELMMMKQAKQARSVERIKNSPSRQTNFVLRIAADTRQSIGLRCFYVRALANMAGVLFIRSYERAEFVYLAMCARRFNARILSSDDFQLRKEDIYFSLAVFALLICIRVIGG